MAYLAGHHGLAPVPHSQSFGLVGGILISFVIFAVIWYISILYEKVEMSPSSLNLGVVFQRFGAWPLLAAP